MGNEMSTMKLVMDAALHGGDVPDERRDEAREWFKSLSEPTNGVIYEFSRVEGFEKARTGMFIGLDESGEISRYIVYLDDTCKYESFDFFRPIKQKSEERIKALEELLKESRSIYVDYSDPDAKWTAKKESLLSSPYSPE